MRRYYLLDNPPNKPYKDGKMNLHRSKMTNVKKTLLHTFYYANNKITCIRCNISGKFVSIKKYLAKQKANKHSNGYLSIIVMLVFVVAAYALCFNTIVERQQQYNNFNNSNELLTNYYSDCSTDTDCEILEAQLNFDFKKGMN